MSYRGRTLGPIRPMCYKIICGLLSTCMLKIFDLYTCIPLCKLTHYAYIRRPIESRIKNNYATWTTVCCLMSRPHHCSFLSEFWTIVFSALIFIFIHQDNDNPLRSTARGTTVRDSSSSSSSTTRSRWISVWMQNRYNFGDFGRYQCQMSKTLIGDAVCWEFESEAPGKEFHEDGDWNC